MSQERADCVKLPVYSTGYTSKANGHKAVQALKTHRKDLSKAVLDCCKLRSKENTHTCLHT